MRNDKRTIAAYEKYAQVYDEEVKDFWENFPTEFINEFSAGLPGNRVLSLGSGSGRDALLLRNCGLEVICVDASKKMVDITSSLGFESVCATFTDFDYGSESFDGIWAYTSLIHVPKLEAKKIIKRICAALRTDGLFVFGAIEGKTAGMIERDTMPGSLRFFKLYERDELRRLIESCGFDFVYECDYQPNTKTYLNQIYRRLG